MEGGKNCNSRDFKEIVLCLEAKNIKEPQLEFI